MILYNYLIIQTFLIISVNSVDQIKQKQYYDSLSLYRGDILLVGISYDEKERPHTCVIERMENEKQGTRVRWWSGSLFLF